MRDANSPADLLLFRKMAHLFRFFLLEIPAQK